MLPYTLADILSPVSPEDFVDRYLGKESLHVPGTPDKFAKLYSLDQFLSALGRPGSVLGHPRIVASFDKRGVDRMSPAFPIAPRDARTAFAAGATICVNRLDEHEPALAELVARVRIALGNPGDMHVNAYWSPHGAGFTTHFDARVATSLQIHGSKHWRYGPRAAVAWPHDNAGVVNGKIVYQDKGEPHEPWEYELPPEVLHDMKDVLLSPGDVLCLPAGTLHEALADGESFALNFTYNRLPVGTYLSALFERHFRNRPEWRGVRPLSPRLGNVNARVEALQARLGEAVAFLQHLQGDRNALLEIAALELSSNVPGPASPLSAGPLAGDSPVIASPYVVLTTPLDARPLTVVVDGQRIEATGLVADIMSRLLVGPSSPNALAKACGVDDGEMLATLRELDGVGLLSRPLR